MSTAAPSNAVTHDSSTSQKNLHSYLELGFNPEEAVKAVGKNWGWIFSAGILSIVAGVLAISSPVLATGVVGLFLACTLFVIGAVNLSGVCFAPKGMKMDAFLAGTIQVLLAAVMMFYPYATLLSLTIILASIFLVEGIARTGLAIMSRDLPGWGWSLAGGLATIALSVIIISGLPGASFWVIGVLVGVNLLMAGMTKTAVAIGLRELTKEPSPTE